MLDTIKAKRILIFAVSAALHPDRYPTGEIGFRFGCFAPLVGSSADCSVERHCIYVRSVALEVQMCSLDCGFGGIYILASKPVDDFIPVVKLCPHSGDPGISSFS